MKNTLFIVILILCKGLLAQGPFAPALGYFGNTAMHKDSSAFVDWATNCSVQRGFMDIMNPSLGYTSVGDSTFGIGKAQENGVVSLGDGGEAILQFNGKIFDGPGADFAVFENAFSDVFLELAFVEVSSDGVNYFRFPAHSHSDTSIQIGSFGTVDATNIHNLAGKYPMNYGTPFDLADLKNESGLDIQKISHVKIVDVIGRIDSLHRRDSEGRIVNDPYPTPFPSGGFDLDAVGVIHMSATSLKSNEKALLTFYPNPVQDKLYFAKEWVGGEFRVYNLSGALLQNEISISNSVSLNALPKGVYFLEVHKNLKVARAKVMKQ